MDVFTDEMVEVEIQRLQQSPLVKLACAEHRQKTRRRQYMYHLRQMEKRGKQLQEQGWTPTSYKEGLEDDE